jgi:hypothetical protein
MDIMEIQGGLLVDRPQFVAAGELLGGGLKLLTASGEKLRNMRRYETSLGDWPISFRSSHHDRALHAHLQPKVAQTYEPLQALHAKYTVLGLLESPDQYQNHAQTCVHFPPNT